MDLIDKHGRTVRDLRISVTDRCNFRCTMCQVSEWEKMTRARDMGLEEFKQLLDEQYGLVEVKLQGMGEALMNAEPFFDMIRYARARHIWVRVTTSAYATGPAQPRL